MPKPPGPIDKANYIAHFFEDPCHAPWTVYVELAAEAAGELALAFIEPTPADVLRFYVKPRGARSAGRFGGYIGGEETEEGIQLLPDINEVVGTRLPFSEWIGESLVHDKLAFFWALDGILERLLWYYLLAEMAEDFLFNWTTLINRSEYCSIDMGGSAYIKRESQFMFPMHLWQAVEPMQVVKSWGAIQGLTSGQIIMGDEGGTVVAGAVLTPSVGVTSMTMGLFEGDDTEPTQSKTIDSGIVPGVGGNFMFRQDAAPNTVWGIEIIYSGDINFAPSVTVFNAFINGFGPGQQPT